MPITKPITVLAQQTLLDICLQNAGEIDGLFDCASANGMGITDDLVSGSEVTGPAADPQNQGIVSLFVGSPPASGTTVSQALGAGIGFMQIQNNFIVS